MITFYLATSIKNARISCVHELTGQSKARNELIVFGGKTETSNILQANETSVQKDKKEVKINKARDEGIKSFVASERNDWMILAAKVTSEVIKNLTETCARRTLRLIKPDIYATII